MRLYGSTLSGAPTKIVWIAAEGQPVRLGDLLLRFDASRLQQELEAERASLGQAEAELVRAQQDARLEVLRGRVEMDAARQQIANAEGNVANQLEGHGQVTALEAETAASPGASGRAQTRSAPSRLRHARIRPGWRGSARFGRDARDRRRRPGAIRLAAARGAIIGRQGSGAARVKTRQALVHAATSHQNPRADRPFTDQIARASIRAESAGLVTYHDLSFGAIAVNRRSATKSSPISRSSRCPTRRS
jgi:multidrug resistance efflux pump